IFGIVRWPAGPKVVTGRRAEDVVEMPGQDAVAEVTESGEGGVRRAGFADDFQGIEVIIAIPDGADFMRVEDETGALSGDGQRQVAVGESLAGLVHPRAVKRGRDDGHGGGRVNAVGDEF